jgi:hypothetical protein
MEAILFERPDAIILANQRSGTHLLQDFLASHPGVHPRGECVLRYKRHWGKKTEHSLIALQKPHVFTNKPSFLNIAIVMYNQVDLYERLCGDLEEVAVIHLLRDPLSTATSVAQMRADRAVAGLSYRAHYHVHESLPSPSPAAAVEVPEIARQIEDWQRAYSARLGSHRKMLKIGYEDISGGREVRELADEIALPLLHFLGLPSHPLRTTLRKTGKASNGPE